MLGLPSPGNVAKLIRCVLGMTLNSSVVVQGMRNDRVRVRIRVRFGVRVRSTPKNQVLDYQEFKNLRNQESNFTHIISSCVLRE